MRIEPDPTDTSWQPDSGTKPRANEPLDEQDITPAGEERRNAPNRSPDDFDDFGFPGEPKPK